MKLRKFFCSFLMIGLTTSLPSYAFQKFSEYRIPLSQIEKVSIGETEVEDPIPLQIFIKGNKEPLVIASDGYADECMKTIESGLGGDFEGLGDEIIQITVHETAHTLNGEIITECARIAR
ncbi:hypothetical protein [Coralliovum pocilloporae]|uniref:hypothetical protein n=1 Tax=Coralliovum pocilloporae TaxID=3066369 RepID=UPI003306F0B2